jgi:hypothetical protein
MGKKPLCILRDCSLPLVSEELLLPPVPGGISSVPELEDYLRVAATRPPHMVRMDLPGQLRTWVAIGGPWGPSTWLTCSLASRSGRMSPSMASPGRPATADRAYRIPDRWFEGRNGDRVGIPVAGLGGDPDRRSRRGTPDAGEDAHVADPRLPRRPHLRRAVVPVGGLGQTPSAPRAAGANSRRTGNWSRKSRGLDRTGLNDYSFPQYARCDALVTTQAKSATGPVPPTGLEPVTGGLENRCSIRLSYGGVSSPQSYS